MRILFEIAHPKHYYQFKNVIKILSGFNTIKVIARKKDIVCRLLEAENIKFEVYGGHGKSIKSKFLILPDIFYKYIKIVKKFKPDMIVSKSSPYAAIIGKVFHIKTCVMPDSEVVTFNNRFVIPFSNIVITPKTYSIDYGKKHKYVAGFFENGYLHPKFLDSEVTADNFGGLPASKFAILRFVGWFANHDVGRFGFSENEKNELIKILKPYCDILISSEANFSDKLKEYKFKAPVNRMHHALFNASLYIGDSQTMATEAALCGTPAIRYNSFVGEKDMSNFKILEEKGMLYNFPSFEDVCQKAIELIEDSSSKHKARERRKTYFHDVGDINQEICDLLVGDGSGKADPGQG
ncbi:DUF354 domain-containing protein [uncultured Desulfobacter sp.]|uniref:DUF354 domain-containing protein n=1 Tax=uncultured Desulfobacter sp. TaxID=240139 RepID=UPI0029F590DE|nr:DUF354 domain-containing protein [uncultured Desulfobacter sp.]